MRSLLTGALATLLVATPAARGAAQGINPVAVRQHVEQSLPTAASQAQAMARAESLVTPAPSHPGTVAPTPPGTGLAPTTAPSGPPRGLATLHTVVDSLATPPGYVRERFGYPRIGRPDPVIPPTTLLARNTLPEMRLSGIVFNAQRPARSMAIVRTNAGRTSVKVGDKLDQYTVVAIERTRIVLEGRFYGVTKRVTLPSADSTATPKGRGQPRS